MTDYKGMAWHVHHSKYLVEFCWSINERIEFIDNNKPEHEQSLRKRLLKSVKGKLPKELIKAGDACDKAGEAYNKAEEARDKAWGACVKADDACDKADDACDKAREACVKAEVAYVKAGEAYIKVREACGRIYNKHKTVIEKLHSKECPDCPWDGKTIFPIFPKN